MQPLLEPVTVLGVIFPETENFAVEVASSREALVEFGDGAAAAVGLDAAAGIEAAARKFFLYVLGIVIVTGPLIYYAMPKKMMWLKYALLGVLGIVAVVAGYIWYIAYTDMTAFAEAAEVAAAESAAAAQDEAAALAADPAEGELI